MSPQFVQLLIYLLICLFPQQILTEHLFLVIYHEKYKPGIINRIIAWCLAGPLKTLIDWKGKWMNEQYNDIDIE